MKFIQFLVALSIMLSGVAYASENGEGKFTNAGNVHWLINSTGTVFIRTNNVGGDAYAKVLAEHCLNGRSIKIVTGIASFVAPQVEKNCQVFRSGHPSAAPAQDVMIITGNTLIVNGDIYSFGGHEVVREYEFMRYLASSGF